LAYLKLNFNINSGFGNSKDKSGPQKKKEKKRIIEKRQVEKRKQGLSYSL